MMSAKHQLLHLPVNVNISNNSDRAGNSSIQRELCLLLEYRDSGASKELFVQITDESDPLVLFSSSMNEVVYSQLQSSQNLLVEFSSFPGHFSSLIKKCISENNVKNPKFILLLKVSDTVGNLSDCSDNVQLEIVELNVFKNLLHLSVPLVPASHKAKLVHLSGCISSLKAKCAADEQSFRIKGNVMLTDRNSLENQLKNISAETKALKEELQTRKFNYSERESMLLAQQKEKLIQAESTFDRRMSRDKRQVEEKVKKKIDEYVNKFRLQNKKIIELTNANDKLDKIRSEWKEKNARLENNVTFLQEEVNSIKKLNNELKHNLEEQHRAGRSLESRAITLEEELQKASSANQRMWEDMCPLRTENEELKSYLNRSEEQLQIKKAECEDMYIQFQESVKFIEKYRSEFKAEKWKSKDLNESLEVSRRELVSKTKEYDVFRENFKNVEQKSSDKQAKLKDVENELEAARKKISDQDVIIRSNENVIGWLNKQLNDFQKTEEIIKQTPLAEAYLTTNRRSHSPMIAASTSNSPNVDASTPVSYGNLKGILALSAVRPPSNDPLSSETDVEKENNSPGLDPKYLKGARNRNGLLRTTFDPKAKGGMATLKKDITKDFKKLTVDNKKPKVKSKSSYFD